jgi:hypothetical protein
MRPFLNYFYLFIAGPWLLLLLHRLGYPAGQLLRLQLVEKPLAHWQHQGPLPQDRVAFQPEQPWEVPVAAPAAEPPTTIELEAQQQLRWQRLPLDSVRAADPGFRLVQVNQLQRPVQAAVRASDPGFRLVQVEQLQRPVQAAVRASDPGFRLVQVEQLQRPLQVLPSEPSRCMASSPRLGRRRENYLINSIKF